MFKKSNLKRVIIVFTILLYSLTLLLMAGCSTDALRPDADKDIK